MKRYANTILLALLACATIARAQSAPAFSLLDARPDAEKKTHFHSLMITNCNYGVRRIGDADIVPAPLEQLRAGLTEALGARLVGRELKVLHFTLDVNSAAGLRESVGRNNRGIVADVMLPMGAKCPHEKMEAGWFAPDEVTTPNPPIIVEMQLELDGQPLAVRSVYSLPEAWEPRVWKPQSRAQVNAALSAAQAKLVAALEQVLPKPDASGAAGGPAADPAGGAASKPN